KDNTMDIQIRKQALYTETIHSDGGPKADTPLKLAVAYAVVKNPYAGRYEPDLIPFMKALRSVGFELATELAECLGKDKVEVYGEHHGHPDSQTGALHRNHPFGRRPQGRYTLEACGGLCRRKEPLRRTIRTRPYSFHESIALGRLRTGYRACRVPGERPS